MIAAVVGAGGKTTVCLALGHALGRQGRLALFTTTTHIYRPQGIPVLIGNAAGVAPMGPLTAAAQAVTAEGKLRGFLPEEIDRIDRESLFDCILTECDGAGGLPVKAPSESEPAFPSQTALAAGVIGLDCLGKPVCAQWVHRPRLFCNVTGARPGDAITCEHLLALIQSPQGLFRGAPEKAGKIVLLNKAELPGVREKASALVRQASLPVCFTGLQEEWTGAFISVYLAGGQSG